MKIKDYLVLKDIERFLEDKRDGLVRANNDYTNNLIMEIEDLLVRLRKIIDKLENED